MPRKHIAISLLDGRSVRDLLHNRLLDCLIENNFEVSLFVEEAGLSPRFRRDWQRDHVHLVVLKSSTMTGIRERALKLRRELMRRRLDPLLPAAMRLEHRLLYPPDADYRAYFREQAIRLAVATNLHSFKETEFIQAAHSEGIPTLGIVRSWDNIQKGLQTRTDHVAVWNQINADEVMQLDRYPQSKVHIVGPLQFDAYFHQDAVWSREQLYKRFDLDPARPYLMFASMGFRMDETYWMDLLMEALQSGQIEGKPQVICRVHPTSHYEHFHRYAKDYPDDVRISFIDGYYPVLGWTMTREDVIEVSNLLRHTQVLITPASTMTIEAAIFNRPTVVTVFNAYEVKKSKKFFSSVVLGKHFGRLRDQNLVPIVERPEDFAGTVNLAIREPDWYQDKRQELVKQYVGFTDGRSIQRLAECMASLAK